MSAVAQRAGASATNSGRARMLLVGIVIAALAVAPLLAGNFTVSLMNDIGIGALVTLGLVMLTGIGGATSFGQAAFVGIAAYATAWLTTAHDISPWLGLPFALLLTGAVGAGHRHADAAPGRPLPAAEHHRVGAVDRDAVRQHRRARAAHRAVEHSRTARSRGWSLADPRAIYYLIWALVGLAFLFSYNLLQSRPGRAIRSLRGGAILLASVGADAYRVRLTLFVTAALFAGLAGWLYAHMNRFVSPSPFDVRASIEYLLMAVAGGLGQLGGALVGSALVLVLKNGLQDVLPMLTQRAGQLEAVAFATLFILLLHFARGGLMGFVRRRTRGRAGTLPPHAPVAPVEPLPHRTLPDRGSPILSVTGRGQALRRAGGGQRRELRREGGRDRRPDRAERRRQVDHVQPAHLHRADDGRARCAFSDQDIAGMPQRQVARLGLARTFQHVKLQART